MDEVEGEYKVGRGRPPLHTRFKKGQSGNRAARPAPEKPAGAARPRAERAGGRHRGRREPTDHQARGGHRSAGRQIDRRRSARDQDADRHAEGHRKARRQARRRRRFRSPRPTRRSSKISWLGCAASNWQKSTTETRRDAVSVIEPLIPLPPAGGGEEMISSRETPVRQRLRPLDEYRALLRRDLVGFAQRCFRELNPRTRFAMSWHIEIIAAKLTALRDGKIRRLIINLPPRHLKSLLASVAFPAWCLGHDPSAQILCVSYAPGPRRQIVARLPAHRRQRLVSADLPDPPLAAARRNARIRHDGPGLPARHLGRRRADRARRRHHHHRRSLKARGGVVAGPAAGGERVVRPHPLQPAERQAARAPSS